MSPMVISVASTEAFRCPVDSCARAMELPNNDMEMHHEVGYNGRADFLGDSNKPVPLE